jgi:hypothetical protein
MDTSEDIKNVLLEILARGLLRIRTLANSGNSDACAIEADHLHNIPSLIRSIHRTELLHFYYDIERPSFRNVAKVDIRAFDELWARLGSLIDAERA